MFKHTLKVTSATGFQQEKIPPGPRGLRLLRTLRAFQHDPLHAALAMMREYGDVVRAHFLFWDIYLMTQPDGVKHVLQENQRNYSKDLFLLRFLRAFLGKGLFTNDGASWLHQRRLMQPAFHHQRLAAFGTLMTDNTVAVLTRWQEFVEQGQPLDVAAEMTRLTLRIVSQALFNVDLSNEADAVGQAFATFRTLFLQYLYAPFPPLHVPTPRNRRMQAAFRTLEEVVRQTIHQRRTRLSEENSEASDLLAMLLSARDEETGQRMDDQQVRDEVMTLLLAGHETTATALTWVWYFLSQDPEAEHRLHRELDEVLSGRLPTVEDLPRLPYTRMVIQEALRVYPPTFGLGRKAITADDIGGYSIPAGSTVLLCPYATHRHPAFWEQPEVFDPERFSAEGEASRPRYAYFPFGGGPRQCIGNTFALMEMQLVLATIAQRYRLQLVPGQRVEPHLSFTIRPRSGLPMTLLQRT